jgi:hypothetical protein
MPEFVRMTNLDVEDFDFHQNNQKRIIPPGGDVIVPWHLAAALFGSPGILNTAPEFARQKQFVKVQALYGFSPGLSSPDAWEANKPKIQVTDLETSEEIVMLMDDPEGIHLHQAPVPSSSTDAEALQRQIATLQAQMQMLLNQSHAQPQPAAAGTSQSPTVTTDTPPPVEPPTDPGRNPAFDVVAAPLPGTEDDATEQEGLLEMGIEIPAVETEPSEDAPQAVSIGDPDDAPAKAPRRKPAPKKS